MRSLERSEALPRIDRLADLDVVAVANEVNSHSLSGSDVDLVEAGAEAGGQRAEAEDEVDAVAQGQYLAISFVVGRDDTSHLRGANVDQDDAIKQLDLGLDRADHAFDVL